MEMVKSLQSAFYPQSTVCSLCFTLTNYWIYQNCSNVHIPVCDWFTLCFQLLGCGTRKRCCFCSKIHCYSQFAVIYNDNSSLEENNSLQLEVFKGSQVASCLVCSTLDWAIQVQALARDIVCSSCFCLFSLFTFVIFRIGNCIFT